MLSSVLYPMVLGMRLTAPADSSTPPQLSRVSNVLLSVATTDFGGRVTVCSPKLSSTVTVVAAAVSSADVSVVEVEQPARATTANAPTAARRYMRVAFIAVILVLHQGGSGTAPQHPGLYRSLTYLFVSITTGEVQS